MPDLESREAFIAKAVNYANGESLPLDEETSELNGLSPLLISTIKMTCAFIDTIEVKLLKDPSRENDINRQLQNANAILDFLLEKKPSDESLIAVSNGIRAQSRLRDVLARVHLPIGEDPFKGYSLDISILAQILPPPTI